MKFVLFQLLLRLIFLNTKSFNNHPKYIRTNLEWAAICPPHSKPLRNLSKRMSQEVQYIIGWLIWKSYRAAGRREARRTPVHDPKFLAAQPSVSESISQNVNWTDGRHQFKLHLTETINLFPTIIRAASASFISLGPATYWASPHVLSQTYPYDNYRIGNRPIWGRDITVHLNVKHISSEYLPKLTICY